ncbi:hypothetical protein HK096_000224 [Nowakowskiella sp. JEL0078]|nr:hypothetical protein HK096_000224 [Nowakowskiella sp. JEL0078]
MAIGTLKVVIVEARNLQNRDFIGKNDPWVELFVDKQQKFKTTVKKDTFTPKWNEDFLIAVNGQDKLYLNVFDKDETHRKIDFFDSDKLGTVEVPLPTIFSQGQFEGWIKFFTFNLTNASRLQLDSTNDTFAQKLLVLNSTVKIGRKVHQKNVPERNNGIFDSKVLSRNHAEIWVENNKVFIKDVKSSNGTFVNGIRLSEEGIQSDPHELNTGNEIEFGIDIMNEDNQTSISLAESPLSIPSQIPLPYIDPQPPIRWKQLTLRQVLSVYPQYQITLYYKILSKNEIRKSNDVQDNIEQLQQTLVEISNTNLISQVTNSVPPDAIPSQKSNGEMNQNITVEPAIPAGSFTATNDTTLSPKEPTLQQSLISSTPTLTSSSVIAHQQQQQLSAESIAEAKATMETVKKQLEEARLESKQWRDKHNNTLKLKESLEEREKKLSAEKFQLEEFAQSETKKTKNLEDRIKDLESCISFEREKNRILLEEEDLRLGEAIEAREESERHATELRATISKLELTISQLQEPLSKLNFQVENLKQSLVTEQSNINALNISLEFSKERESDLLSLCERKEVELNLTKEELLFEKSRLKKWIQLEEERKRLGIQNEKQKEVGNGNEMKKLESKDIGVKSRKNKIPFSEPLFDNEETINITAIVSVAAFSAFSASIATFFGVVIWFSITGDKSP